jgi:hypothetical protein
MGRNCDYREQEGSLRVNHEKAEGHGAQGLELVPLFLGGQRRYRICRLIMVVYSTYKERHRSKMHWE